MAHLPLLITASNMTKVQEPGLNSQVELQHRVAQPMFWLLIQFMHSRLQLAMSLDSVLSHLPSASGQQPSLTHLVPLQQQSMETTLTLLGRDLILEAQRLAYTITIRKSDGTTFTVVSTNCDGSDSTILNAKICSVPITTLMASPYNLRWLLLKMDCQSSTTTLTCPVHCYLTSSKDSWTTPKLLSASKLKSRIN